MQVMASASIIVPVYNTEEHLIKRCFESIVEQTYQQIEIIIVDDGSCNKTARMCDELVKHDVRAKIIHQENAGLSAARNTGFRNSTGSWAMFVDSDDWLERECLQSMIEAGQAAKAQVVMCSWSKDFRKKSQIGGRLYKGSQQYGKEECIQLQSGLFDWDPNYSDVWAKLFLSEFLLKNRLYHNELLSMGSESLDFNLRVFEKLCCATYVDEPYYHYVYNDGSISTGYSEKYIEGLVASYLAIREWISTSSHQKELANALQGHMPNVIATLAISGIFNPTNNALSYRSKCEKCLDIANTMKRISGCNEFDYSKTTALRKITCRSIYANLFPIVALIASIRHIQKQFS